MATAFKILLTVIAVLLAGLAVLAWLIQTQLTPERIRQHLLPLAESRLNREVEFSSVQVGLLRGVTVANLTISQPHSDQALLSVESAQLRYRLWPLLFGKIVIDRLVCDGPVIHLTRMPSGQLASADLLSMAAGARDGDGVSPGARQAQQPTGFPLKLLIEEISLTDGTVFFVDLYRNSQTPYRYQLNNLSFRARQITLKEMFPIDLTAAVNGSQLAVSGHYDFSAQKGDLVLELESLDLVQFAPYYRERLPARLGSAVMSVNLEIDLNPRLLTSKGRIELSHVDLTFSRYPDAPLTQLDVQADYALNYARQGKQLDISTLLLSVNGLQLDSSAQFDFSGPTPQLEAISHLRQLDLRRFWGAMPKALGQRFAHYSPAGVIAGELEFVGNLREPKGLLRSAELKLSEVQARFGNLSTGLNGALSYSEGKLKSDALGLRYGDFEAQLQFAVEQLWSRPVIGSFHLFAQELDLSQWTTPESNRESDRVADAGNGVPSGSGRTRSSPLGPLDLPLQLQGQINIRRLIYRQLVVKQLHTDLSLADNQMKLTNLNGLLGAGTLAGNLWLDLAAPGLRYRGDGSIRQAEIGSLLGAVRPHMKEKIAGRLDLEGSFSGAGIGTEAWRDALQLSGELTLLDGRVEDVPLLQQIAAFLGIQELEGLSFASVTGNYVLQRQALDFNGRLESSRVKLFPQGTWNLIGPLQMRLETRLAPDLMAKLGVRDNFKEVLLDERGWGVLPLRISGRVSQPRVSFDPEALKAQSLKQAKRKAAERLMEKTAPAEQQPKPMRQLLDRTMNRLFGQ